MSDRQARSWNIGEGETMTVHMPIKLTRKNIARMRQYVDCLEMEAEINWDEPPEPAIYKTETVEPGSCGSGGT